MNKIRVVNRQEIVALDRKAIEKVAHTVLQGEEVADYEIVVALFDNAEIHRLNKQFLDHDEPTDVLSFPSGDPGRKLTGDLAVGVEFGLAHANEAGHAVEAEIALYVIHGLLHLCGYDDHEEDEVARMRERESHYLRALGLPDIAPRDD